MENNVEIKDYIEGLLRGIQRKLEAKERDKYGLIRKDVELTEEELLAYKFVNLETERREREYIFNRYLTEDMLEHSLIMELIGISEPTYYKMRGEVLLRANSYLKDSGYGYENCINEI